MGGDFVTIPQFFKEHGYDVAGAGKIFHAPNTDPMSWTQLHYRPKHIQHMKNVDFNWRATPESDSSLEDQQVVRHVIGNLAKFSKSDQPFFQGVGLTRPHVPLICPEKYFDLYALEEGSFMPNETWQNPSIGSFTSMAPFSPGKDNSDLARIPEDALKELRRSYFACVSYVDDLIGELVRSLDDLGLADNTIVSLVADHGFHLGENDWYSKYTSHEISLHVPLLLHIPGRTDGGVRSRSLVELLDLFPTLAEASGVGRLDRCPARSQNVRLCTEGVSLLPLITNPGRSLRHAAFSQIARGAWLTEYTIKTDQYRLVQSARLQRQFPNKTLPDVNVVWRETPESQHRLYDHSVDVEEQRSLIDDPEYTDIREDLEHRLHKHFSVLRDYRLKAMKQFPNLALE